MHQSLKVKLFCITIIQRFVTVSDGLLDLKPNVHLYTDLFLQWNFEKDLSFFSIEGIPAQLSLSKKTVEEEGFSFIVAETVNTGVRAVRSFIRRPRSSGRNFYYRPVDTFSSPVYVSRSIHSEKADVGCVGFWASVNLTAPPVTHFHYQLSLGRRIFTIS